MYKDQMKQEYNTTWLFRLSSTMGHVLNFNSKINS